MRYLLKWKKKQTNLKIPSAGEDVAQLELSHIIGMPLWKTVFQFLMKYRLPYDPAIPLLTGIFTQIDGNLCKPKNLYMNIYTAAIFVINQKGNDPNVFHPVNGYANWNPYNILLLSNKKEKTTDLCYHMDKPQKYA